MVLPSELRVDISAEVNWDVDVDWEVEGKGEDREASLLLGEDVR